MRNKLYSITIATVLLLNLYFGCVQAAPMPQNDIDSSYDMGGGSGGSGGGRSNGIVDYNLVVSHFKDFFMYFPVMMTTLKETMTGFPKFAEGIRILTSKTGRLEEDCKCKDGGGSNEMENTSRYG